MSFLQKIFLSRFAKSVLDKLPLDGYKTILSLVLFALAEAAKVFCVGGSGPVCAGISMTQEIFHSVGVQDITSDVAQAALFSLVLGLYHKVLKWFHG